MAARRTGLGWLIGAAVLAAGGVAFAVVSFTSLSSVRAGRDDASASLAAVEAEIEEARAVQADAGLARTSAENDLRDAERMLDAAERAVTEAEQAESGLEAEQEQASAQEPDLIAAASGYPDLAADVVEAVESHLDTAVRLAELRAEQVEAVTAGRYATFNTLQDRYNGLIAGFNEQADAVSAAMAALPSFEYRDVSRIDPPEPPGRLEEQDLDLDPPTGPARIAGSFPDSIPCTPRDDGCRWYWEITFTETNALGVTINRLGIRYTDRRGTVWVSQSGEWRSVTIGIPALGSASWDTWVQSLDPESEGNLQGATLQVRWEGTDAEGNPISGRARVYLEWRDDG